MSCYFTVFYCLLDLSCDECDVISLYFMCCSANGAVCLVFVNYFMKQLVSHVWVWFYFVVEYYGSV